MKAWKSNAHKRFYTFDLAIEMIKRMEEANNVKYKVMMSDAFAVRDAIVSLRRGHLIFTETVIEDFADGDVDERKDKYGHYKGFTALEGALDDIFNNAKIEEDHSNCPYLW